MTRPLTNDQQQRWWTLKDDVRVRARNRCEWCSRRPMSLLHHRTYARYGGAERAEDVMGVCYACHKAIHGLLPWSHGQPPTIVVGVGSLADRGDSGMGDGALWDAYLKSHPEGPTLTVRAARDMHTAVEVVP